MQVANLVKFKVCCRFQLLKDTYAWTNLLLLFPKFNKRDVIGCGSAGEVWMQDDVTMIISQSFRPLWKGRKYESLLEIPDFIKGAQVVNARCEWFMIISVLSCMEDSLIYSMTAKAILLLGQPKVKAFLAFQKFMKRPQTKFYADTMSDSKVNRSKKVKIYHEVNFLHQSFFSSSIFYLSHNNRHAKPFARFSYDSDSLWRNNVVCPPPHWTIESTLCVVVLDVEV